MMRLDETKKIFHKFLYYVIVYQITTNEILRVNYGVSAYEAEKMLA